MIDAGDDPDYRPMQAAIVAEWTAAKALIGTAPTTRAGLRALEAHLREDRNGSARWCIERPVTLDGRHMGTTGSGGPEGVDWLIAKRAAEIGAV